MRRQELIGAVQAASAATVIGSSVAASSLIVHYPVLTSQAVRYALASVAMAGLLRWRGQPIPRLARRDLGRVIAMALTGLIGFNLCLLAALRLADPAAIGVVIGCTPDRAGWAHVWSARAWRWGLCIGERAVDECIT